MVNPSGFSMEARKVPIGKIKVPSEKRVDLGLNQLRPMLRRMRGCRI
jgi:hypothetical protein